MSKEAQNGLLKSVEDSREHLHFIFCSTEPQKIIETLRNRCVAFEFKEVQDELMWELLFDIVLQESYQPNAVVMDEIIKQVKGKARNALNELQKAIAAGKFKKLALSFEETMRIVQERFEQIMKDYRREDIEMTKEKERKEEKD